MEGSQDNGRTVVLVASDQLGRGGSSELGILLMHSFLNTLGSFSSQPSGILFINAGVRLVTEDSYAVGELKQLEARGVDILACGTCLSRLGLADRVAVGSVSNMYDITSAMLSADKVISV